MVATPTVARATGVTPPPPWFVLFDAWAVANGHTSRQQKAALLDCHFTTYWRYGRGLTPSLPRARKAAQLLGTSVDVLFPGGVS